MQKNRRTPRNKLFETGSIHFFIKLITFTLQHLCDVIFEVIHFFITVRRSTVEIKDLISFTERIRLCNWSFIFDCTVVIQFLPKQKSVKLHYSN